MSSPQRPASQRPTIRRTTTSRPSSAPQCRIIGVKYAYTLSKKRLEKCRNRFVHLNRRFQREVFGAYSQFIQEPPHGRSFARIMKFLLSVAPQSPRLSTDLYTVFRHCMNSFSPDEPQNFCWIKAAVPGIIHGASSVFMRR